MVALEDEPEADEAEDEGDDEPFVMPSRAELRRSLVEAAAIMRGTYAAAAELLARHAAGELVDAERLHNAAWVLTSRAYREVMQLPDSSFAQQ